MAHRVLITAAAAARHHVDDQLGVLPGLVLRARNPYRDPGADIEDAEQHVAVAHDEVAVRVAHR